MVVYHHAKQTKSQVASDVTVHDEYEAKVVGRNQWRNLSALLPQFLVCITQSLLFASEMRPLSSYITPRTEGLPSLRGSANYAERVAEVELTPLSRLTVKFAFDILTSRKNFLRDMTSLTVKKAINNA